jgi:triosephosphate isomerase
MLDQRTGLVDAGAQPFVIPSFPFLRETSEALAGTGCWVGAQDGHWEMGAATGAVPIATLGELGVTMVELGHSERRTTFHETEADITRKVLAALASDILPLLCVGDDERDGAKAASICVEQILSAVDGDPARVAELLIAYEPRWAIGAPEPADPGWVNEVIRSVRDELGRAGAAEPRAILYGGSAGPGILELLVECDGLFLGRSAHDPQKLGDVLDEAVEVARHRR